MATVFSSASIVFLLVASVFWQGSRLRSVTCADAQRSTDLTCTAG